MKQKLIYLAYKFKGANPEVLREKLEKLSEVIEKKTEYKTFIFCRDVQKWGKIKMDMKEVVEKAMIALKKCDALLVEATEKSNGMYFEAGYAKALGKKMIVIHENGMETNFLSASADEVIEYSDLEDLGEKLKGI
jgi:nucleoside 2-deoxyribosyltransferase